MDTNALSEIFNDLLNDSCFMNHANGIPRIRKDTDGQEFLKKYIEYCRKIKKDRLKKIHFMLKELGIDVTNCARDIVGKIQKMINNCESVLKDDVKEFLKNDRNTKNYNVAPTIDAVKKWQSGSREPGRWHLYQIAFALGLKAYLPADIKKNTVLNKTSVNYLFNKVYHQRFVTRTAHELIFIFCLIHGKSYAEALEMYYQYNKGLPLKKPKVKGRIFQYFYKTKNQFPRKLKEALSKKGCQKRTSTLPIFMKKGIVNNKWGFIRDLIVLSPLLEDKYSSVFEKLKEWEQYFYKEEIKNIFGAYHTDHLHRNPVFISKALKTNFQILDQRMRITSALHEHPMSPENEKKLIEECKTLGVTEEVYRILKECAPSGISAVFGKGSQPIISDLIHDVILTEENIFAIKKDNMSHNLIYRNMRKALITAHFFRYWSDIDRNNELGYEDYIGEINEILTDLCYLPLYLKNSYDCFFMLCARTTDPIETYYTVFQTIFNIYNNYNDVFRKANIFKECACLKDNEVIYSSDFRPVIDQDEIQKTILQTIQKLSGGQK